MRPVLVGSLIAVSVSLSGRAHADAEQIATARALALEGIEAVEAGRCDDGAPLLERAEKLHHAAVHLQYLARCRVASGRLVAATELWRRIVREGAPPDASPAVHAAVKEAASELERTLPRLARATIRSTTTYRGLALRLDGAPLDTATLGVPEIVDPGVHVLVARAPAFSTDEQRFTVPEGGSVDVTITLRPEPDAGGKLGGQQGGHDSGAPRSGSSLRTAGWITAAAGAGALVAGTVTVLMRDGRRSSLESDCPHQTCPSTMSRGELEDRKQTIRDLTTASNVLLFGGGALLAGGITMIVLGNGSNGSQTALVVGAPAADAGLTFRGHW
jgi:hypothetical protein